MTSNSGLVAKAHHYWDKKSLEKKIENVNKKISNTSGLVKKTDNTTKSTEIENKMPSFAGKVTTTPFNKKAIHIGNKILTN